MENPAMDAPNWTNTSSMNGILQWKCKTTVSLRGLCLLTSHRGKRLDFPHQQSIVPWADEAEWNIFQDKQSRCDRFSALRLKRPQVLVLLLMERQCCLWLVLSDPTSFFWSYSHLNNYGTVRFQGDQGQRGVMGELGPKGEEVGWCIITDLL